MHLGEIRTTGIIPLATQLSTERIEAEAVRATTRFLTNPSSSWNSQPSSFSFMRAKTHDEKPYSFRFRNYFSEGIKSRQ